MTQPHSFGEFSATYRSAVLSVRLPSTLFGPWGESLGDWRLIERREEDIRHLLQQSGFDPRAARVFRDTTQMAFLVEAKR